MRPVLPRRTAHGQAPASRTVFPVKSAAPAQGLAISGPTAGRRDAGAPRTQTSLLSPAAPAAPIPGAALGTSGASGGSGFFFSGTAALIALIGLLAAALIGILRITVTVTAPQPFLLLPERPG